MDVIKGPTTSEQESDALSTGVKAEKTQLYSGHRGGQMYKPLTNQCRVYLKGGHWVAEASKGTAENLERESWEIRRQDKQVRTRSASAGSGMR